MSERVPDERFNAATPAEKFSWMYAEAKRARTEVEVFAAALKKERGLSERYENDLAAIAGVARGLEADLARLTEQFDALTEAHAADTLTIGDLRVQLVEAKSDLAREHKRATEPPVVTRELARAREGRDKAEAERDALAERVKALEKERDAHRIVRVAATKEIVDRVAKLEAALREIAVPLIKHDGNCFAAAHIAAAALAGEKVEK